MEERDPSYPDSETQMETIIKKNKMKFPRVPK